MSPKDINNNLDDSVDEEIFDCLDFNNPRSFFLFAGAGSGKTRSLVNVLRRIRDEKSDRLRRNRQQIAIITYTNAACEEIKNRLEQSPLFSVSTIHSFAWELIKNYHTDIREWLREALANEIAQLQGQLTSGRAGTKTAIDRENKIKSKTKRLEMLDTFNRFSYNPNGENNSRDSLTHSEVISITTSFLMGNSLMQKILIGRYPVLLIDESQDTKKELIEAFFDVQRQNSQAFTLGLFGDTMQRIYSDGKEDLGKSLPVEWQTPSKRLNHRCPKRVITLLNNIRKNVDGQEQYPRSDKSEGTVRFFIAPANAEDKDRIEQSVALKMEQCTKDSLWSDSKKIKTLILEHHMAARRLGFLNLFEPLSKVERLRIGVLDGSLPSLRFFTELVSPLIDAKLRGDEFGVARIVRKHSPYFEEERLQKAEDQISIIAEADLGVELLASLWKNGATPTLLEILENISRSGLFAIPDDLKIIASRQESSVTMEESSDEERNETIDAWDQALKVSFAELEALREYILDKSRFGTHQGVKGLEFPRVVVILNDDEARGFLFSYEKILGAKPLSDTDNRNKREGKETSLERTLRLFYVACSRAENSLAIIAYTSDSVSVEKHLLSSGWFTKDEVEYIN